MTNEKKKSELMLDELSKMSPMVIATAYLHAVNYTLYGVDVTEKWLTALQNVSALEEAYNKGYYDALQRQTERESLVESQPCEDCVSRNHMIDVIKGKIADVPRNANGTYQRDNGMFVNGLHRALELVLNAPSIAPSRPQGEWEIFRDCEGKTRVCICKICGHKTGKYQWTNPNFCENCGARMNGGDEE